MDGVYEASINSPMGKINIRLALKQDGRIINGMIEIMGSKSALSQGRVEGNRCYFIGEIRSNTMSLKYNLIGELIGNVLNIDAKTSMGQFKLQAKKIA